MMTRHPGCMLVLALLAPACASAWDTRPIQQKYARQLSQVEPGISLNDFSTILPRAYRRGQTSVEGKVVTAYELIWRHTEHRLGDRVSERLWFYFYDNRLIKWGSPNDWPLPADFVIEHRVR